MIARARSLETRLLGISLLWILLALGVAAFALSGLYREHVESEQAERAAGYLDELAAAIDVRADGTVVLQRDLSDPLFRRPFAGLYWEVRIEGRSAQRSRSLWNETLALPPRAEASDGATALTGPEGQPLLAWTRTLRYPQLLQPVTMTVAADRTRVDQMAESFTRTLAISLAILALGLMGVVVAQVQIGLAPLRRLGRAMTQLRDAQVDRIEGDYPSEVRPLVEDLNAVLQENRELLARARAQAGNLAHALKTPLAVIHNSLQVLHDAAAAAPVAAEVERMREAIERHLVRARAGAVQMHGPHVPVRAALDDVLRAIQRIHGDRVTVAMTGEVGARFRGDAADLQEIFGNLLDNAAKWARSRVQVAVGTEAGRLRIVIEDDGPGIPVARRMEALQRGVRLDSSRPGSGLGLQIVDELCRVYGGSLTLGDSALGGLAATVMLPAR